MNNFNFAMSTAIKLTKNDWLKLFMILIIEAILAFVCFMAGPPIAYIGMAAIILGFLQSIVMTFIAINLLLQLDKSGRANFAAGAILNGLLVVHSIKLSAEAVYAQSYPFVVFGILSAIIFGSFLVVNIGALIIKFRNARTNK